MSLPIVMYGGKDCDDTETLRDYFNAHQIVFREVNIDENHIAEQFVIFINDGFRSTPTLVLGSGKNKIILTEPSASDFEKALKSFDLKTDP